MWSDVLKIIDEAKKEFPKWYDYTQRKTGMSNRSDLIDYVKLGLARQKWFSEWFGKEAEP
jgi:hypothetical protein